MTQQDLSPEALIRRYEVAAGKAAVIELKLRILFEIVPDIEHHAHDFPLDATPLVAWFAAQGDPVSAADEKIIAVTRTLRNKLLHGDLRKARDRMQELGAEKRRSAGGYLKLDSAAGNMLGQLEAAIASNTFKSVSDTKTADVGIGMWLMEFGVSDDFEQAATILGKTADLIENLISRAHAIETKRPRAEAPRP